MRNLEKYIYRDGVTFYLDTENYGAEITERLGINFESGDIVKWKWDDKRLTGKLRQVGGDNELFEITNVGELS